MAIYTQEWNQAFPSTGIDQVVLTSTDFVLRDWARLTTQLNMNGGGEIISPVLAKLPTGEELVGRKAWYNADWWGITLSCKDRPRLRVNYNPSRIDGTSNLIPASGRQVARASEELMGQLAEKGIELNPSDVCVSSIEVASPVLVDRPIEQYLDALEEWARPKYLNETRREPGWLCFSNGSRSIQFYDKHLQLEGEQKEEAPYRMRIESKAKRGQTVKAMGIDFDHLLNGSIGPAVIWHHDMMQNCIGGINE